MRFVVSNQAAATERLKAVLLDALTRREHVLWLVSGGSNVALAAEVMTTLDPTLTPKLTTALIDERYGLPGHPDSNQAKYQAAGLDSVLPVLQTNLNLPQTAARYAEVIGKLFESCDYVLAQAGIGSDGHTAGILPGSAAVDAAGLVASYKGPDFQRITLTFSALKRADQTLVFAFGADKTDVLHQLKSENLPLDVQPAQIFKQIPRVEIYNDSIEGDA
jgi:6-phosphogluconolactonase